MDLNSERLFPTRDHVVPASQGGQVTVFACRQCNEIKADMSPAVWEAFMAAFPAWWRMRKFEIRRARRTGFATKGFKLPRHMRVSVDDGSSPSAAPSPEEAPG
jgi:hypothetical protein